MVPKLDGVDELLNTPLDEECLQRLLSGDELDEDAAAVRVPSLPYSPPFLSRIFLCHVYAEDTNNLLAVQPEFNGQSLILVILSPSGRQHCNSYYWTAY